MALCLCVYGPSDERCVLCRMSSTSRANLGSSRSLVTRCRAATNSCSFTCRQSQSHRVSVERICNS